MNWKFCPQCGKELVAGWKYCAECGQAIGMSLLPQVVPYYVPYPVYPAPIYPVPYHPPHWGTIICDNPTVQNTGNICHFIEDVTCAPQTTVSLQITQ